MYRRVVPGLPVMMALGNALSDAARKQAHHEHTEAQPSPVALQPPTGRATPPASKAA